MVDNDEPKGFDDFDLRIGDVMRGERATMGKSLLDVQRELRIKASYIAAIEDADPSAFETPGFIAGFVRSYARYLNLDPDWCFHQFCRESGFQTAHGMSAEASGTSKLNKPAPQKQRTNRDPFADPDTPFVPRGEALLSRIEPGALGSSLVLVALIGFIGWGGYTVFNQVQRVEFVPVDQAPGVVAELEALQPEGDALAFLGDDSETTFGGTTPSIETVERLYRPEALEVPVLTARDAPIASLDPSSLGTLADQPVDRPLTVAVAEDTEVTDPETQGIESALAAALGGDAGPAPQVLAEANPGVTMVAVRPAWVRVNGADGTILFEAIMNAGDTYQVPQTEDPATLRIGESGAVYFAINGQTYGPVGERGSVTSNLALAADALTESYEVADIQQDQDLERVVAELNLAAETPSQD